MKNNSLNLNEIIGLIYETSQEPNLWPILLEGLTSLTEEKQDLLTSDEDLQRTESYIFDRNSHELSKQDINEYGELALTLIPHIRRALKINKQLIELQEERNSVVSILEGLPIGILLVRDNGKILNMNSFARKFLDENELISEQNEYIKCLDPFSDKKIGELIVKATIDDRQESNTFSIQHDDHKNDFSLYISPARSELFEGVNGNVCTIFIATAEASKTLSRRSLKELYGLSAAEIRLAQHLVDGRTLDEATERFYVSHHTVKTQLKSIFTKTGTSRQAELVGELLSNPALVVKDYARDPDIRRSKGSSKTNKPNVDSEIKLHDGRILAYTEYGSRDGIPVLFFHNMLNGRFQAPAEGKVLEAMNICLIAPERNGFGRSSSLPGRSLKTWAEDIAEFTNGLGIDDYYVLGHSTGGPYAAACAYFNHKNCIRAGMVSSMAPYASVTELHWMRASDKLLMGMARNTPLLLVPFLKAAANSLVKNPKKFIKRYTSNWFVGDIELLHQGSFLDDWADSLEEAVRYSVDGIFDEIFLTAKPWGFKLSEIQTETFIWHGTDDNSVDLSFAKKLAEIPDSRFVTYTGEGHLIILNHWQEIISELVN